MRVRRNAISFISVKCFARSGCQIIIPFCSRSPGKDATAYTLFFINRVASTVLGQNDTFIGYLIVFLLHNMTAVHQSICALLQCSLPDFLLPCKPGSRTDHFHHLPSCCRHFECLCGYLCRKTKVKVLRIALEKYQDELGMKRRWRKNLLVVNASRELKGC